MAFFQSFQIVHLVGVFTVFDGFQKDNLVFCIKPDDVGSSGYVVVKIFMISIASKREEYDVVFF